MCSRTFSAIFIFTSLLLLGSTKHINVPFHVTQPYEKTLVLGFAPRIHVQKIGLGMN